MSEYYQSEYDLLKISLLKLLAPCVVPCDEDGSPIPGADPVPILELPRWGDDVKDEERIAITICDSTPMTLERWLTLCTESRIPCLERAIAVHSEKQAKASCSGSDAPSCTVCTTGSNSQGQTATPFSSKAIQTIMGKPGQEILDLVHAKLSASDKATMICNIDRSYLAWNSEEWGDFLGVTSDAIRGGHFWKVERKRLIGDD